MISPTATVSLALCVLALCGCQSAVQPLGHSAPKAKPLALTSGTPEEMRYAALSRVPVGTSLSDAKTLLEDEGFRCSYVREQDKMFLYARPKDESAEIDEPVSLLFSLVHKRVSDVEVIDGPLPVTIRGQSNDAAPEAAALGN